MPSLTAYFIAGTQVVSVSANNLEKNEHESLENPIIENAPEVRLASRWLRFWALEHSLGSRINPHTVI